VRRWRALLALSLAAAALALVAVRREAGQGAPSDPSPPPPAEGEEMRTLPLPARSYGLRQGEALFLHYCATCHGESGEGDGFNAYNLDPKPRDLADPAFAAERSDEELAAILRTGGGAVGLSNAMPPWGRTLSDRQIGHLVAYLRVLPEVAAEADSEE
jgi:mono/diheme cytochrome c family protein